MKFDVTVKDLSGDEASALIAKLTGETKTDVSVPSIIPVPQEVQQAAASLVPNVTDTPEVVLPPTTDTESGVDADGLPWDGRIHSSNKQKKADGTWRARRGVHAEEVAAVQAELRGTPTPMPPVQAPTPMPPVQAPTPMPPVQAPTPMPAVAVPPAAPVGNDFTGLLTKISTASAAGIITQDYVTTLVNRLNEKFGLQMAAITAINGQQHLIDEAFNLMTADGY